MWEDSKTILNAESQKQLNKQHDDLLRKSFKLLLLKKLLLENKELPRKSEEIALAVKIFRAREYLQLENDNLLNLHEQYSNINLPYNAQKDVQKTVWQALQIKLNTIRPVIEKLLVDFPQLLAKKQSANSTLLLIPNDTAELLDLDKQRRAALQKLAEIENRKLKLIKAVAEIKLHSGLAEKIEVMHLDLCINQVKANLFRDYMINEFVNNSEHTVKAIKVVEKHIDERLNKEDAV